MLLQLYNLSTGTFDASTSPTIPAPRGQYLIDPTNYQPSLPRFARIDPGINAGNPGYFDFGY
jgi:hypothetical protein